MVCQKLYISTKKTAKLLFIKSNPVAFNDVSDKTRGFPTPSFGECGFFIELNNYEATNAIIEPVL